MDWKKAKPHHEKAVEQIKNGIVDKKPPEKAIFRQRQFVRYVKGKEICIRVINGDIKNENQKEATRLRGNFPPFNQK
jgi:hypothetical protein